MSPAPLWRRLALGVGMWVGMAQAGRVQVADLGVSIDVPAGWVLSRPAANEVLWQDTTLTGMRGYLGVLGFADTAKVGERPWVVQRTQAARATVETDPFSILYMLDSTTQDGKFSMFLNYTYIPDSLAIGFHDRYAASGNTGYLVYAYGDTADFYVNYPVYSMLLDSVKFLPGFQGLASISPRLGTGNAGTRLDVRNLSRGLAFQLLEGSPEGQNGEHGRVVVADMQGRTLFSSVLEPGKTISWCPPSGRGLLVVRLELDGHILESRPVLRGF